MLSIFRLNINQQQRMSRKQSRGRSRKELSIQTETEGEGGHLGAIRKSSVNKSGFCQKTTTDSDYKGRQDHGSFMQIQTLLEQNQLLHEAVRVRDRENRQLRGFLDKYKSNFPVQQDRQEVLTTSNYEGTKSVYCQGPRQLMGGTVMSLTEQLDTLKEKYLKSIERNTELENKLRSVMNKSQLTERQLREELESMGGDMKYQRDEYERVVDNMKIQAEERLFGRLRGQGQRHKKEDGMLEEQIKFLKKQSDQKSDEINRLNDKLRKEKQQGISNNNFFEKQNKELKRQLDSLQVGLRAQMKFKQDAMNEQFRNDLEGLHRQQKREVQILCQRINTLKVQLKEKQEQVREYWRARDGDSQKFRSRQNGMTRSVVRDRGRVQLRTQASMSIPQSVTKQINLKTSVSTHQDTKQSALLQYMK